MKNIREALDQLLWRSYEEAVVLFLSGVAVGILVPFVILRALSGEWLRAGIDTVVLVAALSVWLYVWRTGRTAIAAPLWSMLLLAALVAMVHLFGPEILYWAFPVTAAAFFLVPPAVAAMLSGAAAAAISPQVLELGSGIAITGFYPALLATNLLALAIVTAMNRHRSQLKTMVERDALTGLPNRTLLADRISTLVQGARRDGHCVGVLLLDLDEFKLINDTLGHGAGDKLLRRVATRLQSCVRAENTVARFGGDEFVVAVRLPYPARATDIAERIAATLRPPFNVNGSEVTARASIGISLFPQDSATADGLLQAADTAMYVAKRSGRSQYHYFDESMNRRLNERLQVEAELRQALDRGELVLYYQPRIALADDSIVGAEALLRWHHPERGVILPEDFLGIAEQSALIGEIDRYVLQSAGRQAAAWRAAGHELLISVNLSARDVHRDGVGSEVARLLTEHGADPAGIEVEITESMVMQDFEHAKHQLQDLRECAPGLRIALDDFGTGYSSLQYLRQLPIDTLKIERSFIADLSHNQRDPTAWAIARTIIELGHHLGLWVTAEGVETMAQVELLRSLGCDDAQGFWFAPPLPAGEFEHRTLRSVRKGPAIKARGSLKLVSRTLSP